MNQKNIDYLYQKVIENSWNSLKIDYLHFLYEHAKSIIKSEKQTYHNKVEEEKEIINLIDAVLKKMLMNLKNNISIKKYDQIIFKIENYNNQEAYDFTIGLIKTYYKNEFKMNNKTYRVLDIMNTIVEENKKDNTLPIPIIFNYIIANLFRIHYALYILKKE